MSITGGWDPATGQPYSEEKKGQRYLKLPKQKRPDSDNPLNTAFERHRAGEKRTAAVRALVLYPMNALVEDQLVRLRKALHSARCARRMQEHFHGNRIFFGRYIGATEVTGHPGSTSPRGLDSFLLAGKAAAKQLGSIKLRGHKLADANDDVAYEDVWKDEKDRRGRRLTQLFEYMAGLEAWAVSKPGSTLWTDRPRRPCTPCLMDIGSSTAPPPTRRPSSRMRRNRRWASAPVEPP